MRQYKGILIKCLTVPLLALTYVCALPLDADAKTLYVNSTNGNDATSYVDNNENNPWRTIGRAAWGSTSHASPNANQAAQAGDIVLIASGIYWESGSSSGNRFTVSLNPANNGTATNRITFRGVGLVYIRMNAGYRGGMIGCNGRNYITWDNFQIDDYYGGSTSDTGPVVFSGNCQHCQIINSDIKGHAGSYYHGYPTFGGNYRGISLEPAHNTIIRNNRIHQFTGGQNEAGIMAYDSNDNVIENNEIYNNGQGVFIKGVHPGSTQARNIIRYNILRDNYSGIRALGAEDTKVYQNIILNSSNMALWAGFSTSTRSRFVNNTVYGNARGIVAQGIELIDVQFHNNIVVNTAEGAIYNWEFPSPASQNISFNRNLYYNNTNHATYDRITFSQWQATYAKDINGMVSNPLFIDPANSNFRLQANSPARTLGIDILDINGNGSTSDQIPAGAYITGNETIGLLSQSSVSDIIPPMPPANLQIQ